MAKRTKKSKRMRKTIRQLNKALETRAQEKKHGTKT